MACQRRGKVQGVPPVLVRNVPPQEGQPLVSTMHIPSVTTGTKNCAGGRVAELTESEEKPRRPREGGSSTFHT
eukprot:2277167-Rhodomonas_salina.2